MSLLLLVDDSNESKEAEKLLKANDLEFLTVKPEGLTPKSTLPVLLDGSKRIVGYDAIKRFATKVTPPRSINHVLRLTLGILHELGIRVDLSSFDKRLRIQKIVFLLQQFGSETNWEFNWYLRGPYSPALAHQLFDNAATRISFSGKLDEKAQKALSRLSHLIDVRGASSEELETAASVLYIMRTSKFPAGDQEKLISLVCELKPNLDGDLVKKYVLRFQSQLVK